MIRYCDTWNSGRMVSPEGFVEIIALIFIDCFFHIYVLNIGT